MDKSELAASLEFARSLAREAGELTARYFGKKIEVETKSDESPVTIADKETEKLCRKRISEKFPDHGIIGEEFGSDVNSHSRYSWVIDPIDGTKSFISGIPLYTVLLALLEDGKPVLGVIHQPILKETAFASVGGGSFYNDAPCHVRAQADLSKAWLLCTDPTHLISDYRKAVPRLLSDVALSRSWGDAYGYLMLVSGRADIMIDPRMHLWDVASLKPIVEEAGGAFSDLQGRNGLGESCLAASPELHRKVLSYFTQP